MKDVIYSDDIILFYYESVPTVYFKIDNITYNKLRLLKNANGEYICEPYGFGQKTNNNNPGKLWGVPIVLIPINEAPIGCFQLETHFPNGQTIIKKIDESNRTARFNRTIKKEL